MVKTHVVVGGGSSGLFLCRRLLEQDNVILIERGENPQIVDTIFTNISNDLLNMFSRGELWPFTALITKPVPSRMYVTKPQSSFFGRQLLYAQGIGLGGTSNVNAMLFTPGSPLVFDSFWPKQWNSKDLEISVAHVSQVVKPSTFSCSGVMRKVIENGTVLSSTNPENKESIWDSNSINSQYRSFINDDGCTRMKLSEKVLPIHDPNAVGQLTVIRNATVSKVIFKGKQAVSVLIQQAGGPSEGLQITPSNGGEIILCAGVFETPRILLNSQISRGGLSTANLNPEGSSPVPEEEEVSLPVLSDLGLNLQDHPVVPYLLWGNWYCQWSLRFPSTSARYRNRPRYPLNGVHGWINLDADGNLCDNSAASDSPASCQFLFVDGRILAGLMDQLIPRYPNLVYRSTVRPFLVYVAQTIMKFSLVQWALGYFFGILICLTQPRSRGRLSTDRTNPTGPLLVDPQYLTDDRDVTVLRNGLRAARELIATTASKDKLRCVEVLPGPLFNYANRGDTFKSYAAFFTTTYFHACGTCAMSDTTASNSNGSSTNGNAVKSDAVKGVVGPDLKVHHVEGLRIADASVIPHIPNSPISVICMAIGDICGKLILQDKK